MQGLVEHDSRWQGTAGWSMIATSGRRKVLPNENWLALSRPTGIWKWIWHYGGARLQCYAVMVL